MYLQIIKKTKAKFESETLKSRKWNIQNSVMKNARQFEQNPQNPESKRPVLSGGDERSFPFESILWAFLFFLHILVLFVTDLTIETQNKDFTHLRLSKLFSDARGLSM